MTPAVFFKMDPALREAAPLSVVIGRNAKAEWMRVFPGGCPIARHPQLRPTRRRFAAIETEMAWSAADGSLRPDREGAVVGDRAIASHWAGTATHLRLGVGLPEHIM